MFLDDDKPKPKTQEFPRRLVDMSVAELELYITDLEAEITRVQYDIQKKKASRDAAASIFKS
jgi:uncharacterized small protein (DUF1192 family)